VELEAGARDPLLPPLIEIRGGRRLTEKPVWVLVIEKDLFGF
jgi:hypothetical protein